jgi:hypothetical protein
MSSVVPVLTSRVQENHFGARAHIDRANRPNDE